MTAHILILRPEPGASATAAKARALGLEPIIAPLFETRAVAWDAPDAALYEAIMMTSANAARHAGAKLTALTHLPLYAGGATTATGTKTEFQPSFTGNF